MAHPDNLDHHRCNDSDAQDPTSMTIEFLRARLLAERAVSKSARAKLDGLADKVAELEEQLKIVSLQRKKAEQATADVLAILAENGFTNVSDGYESSSDQESYSQTSSVSGKSLSWKGRRREAASSDKAKESRNRRQRGFDSAYIWRPRHRQGRSCRQIKRRESRTVSEDHKGDENAVVDLQDGTEAVPNASEEASRAVVDVAVVKGDQSSQNVLEKRDSMDVNLERALAKRAQVIGSFEDMEETQKQWEKEFTDNKSSALDVCDVGNHSDVTDESNGGKAQGSTVANEVEALSHGSPDNSVRSSPDKCCKSCGSKSVEQDASPCGDKGKQIPESPKSESSHSQSSKGISEHSSSTVQPPPVTRPNSRGSSFCSNAISFQKAGYPLVPVANEKSDTCETVLTALKQAKLSLQEKVNSLHIRKPQYQSESSYPSAPGSYMNTYALPIEAASASNSGSMVEFPVGFAGLFRVPTDFSPDASTRNRFLSSSTDMLMSMSHCGGSMLLLVAVFLVLLESSTSLISSPSSIINPSKVKQVSSKPRAFVYEGFLTDLECDHLISLAKENLQRSAVADNDNGESQVSDVRTSSGTFISKGKDPIVSGIEDKLSTWTFLPKENGEDLQVLRYEHGQKYDAHFDYFHDKVNIARGGHRIATVLMYLSNVTKGGETVFPDAVESSRRKLSVNKDDLSECAKKGIAVKPRKGDALLFFNLHEDATPDTLSLHGGCPVIEGEKWSATKWIHVDSFDKIVTHDGNCTDVNESCERWAVLGECAKNPEYMVGTPELPGNCRRSCKAC